jgi:hypothetical protein
VHENDSHVNRVLIALHGFLPILQDWYFRMHVSCVDFYLCDFDRCDSLVLVLYGDVIIFIGHPKQLVMWYLELFPMMMTRGMMEIVMLLMI